MSDEEEVEEIALTILEMDDEGDMETVLLFFEDVPFLINNEFSSDVDEIMGWINEVQVQLVILGHYLSNEGPSAFMAQQLTSMARQIWLAGMRVASMTPELIEIHRNRPDGVA